MDAPTSRRRPGDLAEVLILQLLRQRGPSTRRELVRLTGLTKTTLVDHVRTLVERGLVIEREPTADGPGRPARRLEASHGHGSLAVVVLSHGADLLTGPIRCLASSPDGSTRRFATLPAGTDPLASAAHAVRALVGTDLPPLSGAVIGVPLPLIGAQHRGSDRRSATVISPLAHLIGSRPQQGLAELLGVPALLAGDVELAALGEGVYGAGRDAFEVAFLRVISGLGLGLSRGRTIPARIREPAGEIAHIRRPGGGDTCFCGAVGCWYTTPAGRLDLASKIRPGGHGFASLDELQDAVVGGARPAIRAVRRMGRSIGQAMGSFYSLARPDAVVLEAELGPLHRPLAAGIAEALEAQSPGWMGRAPTVLPGLLEGRADLLGGLRLLTQLAGEIDRGPVILPRARQPAEGPPGHLYAG